VSSTTGELQVMHKGYDDNPDIRMAIESPDAVARILDDTPGIVNWSPRAEAFTLADSGKRSYGVMVIGIDIEREPKVSNIRTVIREGEYFSSDTNEIILGRKLARNLQVAPGDEVVLLGQGYDGSVAANVFNVRGIAETGQPELDRQLAEIPLGVFQDTFFMGQRTHRMVITSQSLKKLDQLAASLRTRLADVEPDLVVRTWDQLLPGLKQSIELDMISGYISYFLLLVVVAFSIMNTFIMAVFERSAEFGILNAIGTTRYRLVYILVMETTFLALCGIALGFLAGFGISWYFQEVGFVIPDTEKLMAQFGVPNRIYPKLSFFISWLAPFLVLCVALVSTLYPAFRLLRLNPVQAMHDQ